MEKSPVRVFVVEDYKAFRQFISSTLRKRPELQIIGETSDGLEAVHKAEELQPDLIVLDIGLPSLNGIEAARRIRKLSPESRILFISQESSADVVQEALNSGALGYVVKRAAGNELLAAVGAVLQGRQYLSSGLSAQIRAEAADSQSTRPLKDILRSHDVAFYSDDAAFVDGFARFIEVALEAGNAVIAVATEAHRKSLFQSMQEHGVDIAAAIEQGRYVSVDVSDTLLTFMVNDLPDSPRFFRVAGDLIASAAQSTLGGRVAICGECGSILWAQGKADAAVQVEQLCSQLARRYEMDILCGFSLSSFYHEEDKQIFEKTCRE